MCHADKDTPCRLFLRVIFVLSSVIVPSPDTWQIHVHRLLEVLKAGSVFGFYQLAWVGQEEFLSPSKLPDTVSLFGNWKRIWVYFICSAVNWLKTSSFYFVNGTLVIFLQSRLVLFQKLPHSFPNKRAKCFKIDFY